MSGPHDGRDLLPKGGHMPLLTCNRPRLWVSLADIHTCGVEPSGCSQNWGPSGEGSKPFISRMEA